MADKIIIDYVRDRPHMWNFNRNDTHMTSENGSWEHLSQLLGVDIIRLKKRWRYLRDAYVRARKAMAEGSCAIPKWKYYNEMIFLDQVVRHRTVPMDISEESKMQLLSQNCVDSIELDFSEQAIKQEIVLNPFTNDLLSSSSTSSPKISSTCNQTISSEALVSLSSNQMPDMPSLSNSVISTTIHGNNHPTQYKSDNTPPPKEIQIQSRLSQNHIERDDITLFGEQIAASLRKLSARAQSHAKIRIQQVIFELEQNDFGSA